MSVDDVRPDPLDSSAAQPSGMCPHARPDWRSCPHCLGVNTGYAMPPLDVPPSEGSEWDEREGFRVEWAPDERSRPATPEEFCTRKCRRPRCGGEPVMAFRRRNGWWLYCGEHMYGRRINNGVVEARRIVRIDDDE